MAYNRCEIGCKFLFCPIIPPQGGGVTDTPLPPVKIMYNIFATFSACREGVFLSFKKQVFTFLDGA